MTCRDGYFKCGSGACINVSLTCNGVPDCRDSSDEDDRQAGCKGYVYFIFLDVNMQYLYSVCRCVHTQ